MRKKENINREISDESTGGNFSEALEKERDVG